jgi:hypothetical protein
MAGATALDVVLLTPGPRGRLGLPTISWGAPGIAKTARVEQAARRHGLPLETVILSIREPADVAGLPVVRQDGVHLEPPAWAKRLATAGKGLVHLDELSCASPSVQAAALRVVAEGVVGELPLPPEVRILASANPEDLAAGGWGLAAPMANRLIHVNAAVPTAEEWGDWLIGNGKADESTPPILNESVWEREWVRARASFAGFARRFPDRLLKVPEGDAERGRAWPSHRSMELAARAAAGTWALGAGDGVLLVLLRGAIGDGIANEVFSYLRDLDIPDPEDVLAGRAKVPMKRTDQAYASLSSVVSSSLLPRRDRNDRIASAFEVAGDVAAKHADVAAACIRAACNASDLKPVYADGRNSKRIQNVLAGPLKAVASALGGGS